MNRYVGAAFGVFAAVVVPWASAAAQNYPDHPVKIIVPYPAGGPADTVARVSTQGLGAELGGNVIIENVAGAGGRIATKDVTRAAPDGYTLLLGSSNEYAITPALYQKLDFDPVKELVPVAPLVTDSIAIVVHPALPVNSLKELAAYANAHPGKLTSGSTVGIAPHLALMYFEAHMHANIVFVPYKGAAPALTDLLAGRTQMTILSTAVIVPPILDHRLRALAVTSTTRWHELPDVPTMAEAGYAGFPQGSWTAVVAPARTPPDVVARLNATINDGLRTSELRDGLTRLGAEIKIDTPQQLGALLADESRKWAEVVKSAGVAVN